MIFLNILVGLSIYFLIWFGWSFIGMFPDFWDYWFVFPKFTSPLIASVVTVYVVGVLGGIFAYIFGKVFLWFIPPSFIEIGDEAEEYKKKNTIRQTAFWTIIVGGIVSIVVNLIT